MQAETCTEKRPDAAIPGWRLRLQAAIAPLVGLLKGEEGADAAEDGKDEHGAAGLGALLSFGVRVASAFITFLAQVLMARWLGAHDFGIYTYVWVVVNVVGTLATFGLSITAVRFLNEYFTHNRMDLARGFLRFGRVLSFGIGLLAAVGGIVILHTMPWCIDADFRRPLMVGLLSLPAFALTDFHDGTGRARSWLLLAFVPPYILRPLMLLVFVALGVWVLDERTALMAAVALVAATWLVAGVQYVLQDRRFRADFKDAAAQMDIRQWVWVSLPLLLLDSFTLLMTNIDVLILKAFVSADQIAVYFAAARVISFVAFIHFAVVAVAMPRFATAYAKRDIERAGKLLRQFRLWTFGPSLLAAAFLLAVGPFVLALFGPEFPAAWPVITAV